MKVNSEFTILIRFLGEKMQKRDTVIEALNHRKTERIPHYINFASPLESKLKGYYKISNLSSLLEN